MNISCPECKTTFIIADQLISNTSKKLKCSKCKHVWTNNHDTDLGVKRIIDLPSVSKIKTTLDLEAKQDLVLEEKCGKLFYIYPIFIGILIIILTSITAFGIKIPISCTVPQALILKDIKLKNLWKEQKIVLNYRVHNNSEKLENLPLIRIRLFDKNSKILKTHIIKDRKELKPAQFVNINTEFESIMQEANKVDIALGTWFDFLVW